MCDFGRNIKSALLANTVCPAALQKLSFRASASMPHAYGVTLL